MTDLTLVHRPHPPLAGRLLTHLLLLCGGFAMIAPLLYQVVMSLSTDAEAQQVPPHLWPAIPQWHNYSDVFSTIDFAHQLLVTVLITVIRTAAQVVLSCLAGYAFARMRFRGQGVILGVILSVMMIPPEIYLIPQYQIVQSLGWLNSIQGIVAPGLATAFGTFLMRQFFKGLPDELEDAARLDGANTLQVFYRIMVPLARNGIFALGIITAMWSWNQLLWPLVITTDPSTQPLSVGIATLQGLYQSHYPMMMAASLMAMAPTLILFVLFQKRVIAGVARTGLK